MHHRTIVKHKRDWNLMILSSLWVYRTSAKISTGFTPFQLVYDIEATFSFECEIPSLKLAIKLLPHTSPKEEHMLYLNCLDETCRLVVLVLEA